MEKKKSNTILTVVVILLGISAFAGAFFYASYVTADKDKSFNPAKESRGELLYREITNLDFENEYPDSANEILEYYNKIYLLLYGNMFVEEKDTSDEKIQNLIQIQRKLFSDELVSRNDFDDQYSKFMGIFSSLAEKNLYIIDISSKEPVYDSFDQSTCTIETTCFTNTHETFTIEYELIKENNFWKISFWNVKEPKGRVEN